jgi:hypothetical protein
MLGLGAEGPQSWQKVLIDSTLNLAMQNESVQKVMNIFSTMLKGLVDWALAPLADILVWLYDAAIVPLGNGMIWIINGLIKGINKVLEFFKMKTIGEIAQLQTSKQVEESQARIAAKTQAVSDTMDGIRQVFDDRRKDIEDAYQQNVGALKNLLELGALTEADYAARIGGLNTGRLEDIAQLDETERSQLEVLKEILESLNAGSEASDAALHAAGVPGYAAGAVNIPQTQAAIVHKGETIVPASFAEGLRSGELTLGRGGGGVVISITAPIHVTGSVIAEDDLAEKIAVRTGRLVKRGLLEAGVET